MWVEGQEDSAGDGDGDGSWVGTHFMLLSQEFGKLPIAPHSLLRQSWARPLHQYKIVLVDGGGGHLWRMRLLGKGLLAHEEQLVRALTSSCPLLYLRCPGSPLRSYTV